MSTNFITNIISIILLAFTASGLDVDPNMTAQEIVKHISSGQWLSLGLLFATNLGNSFFKWFKTWRENPALLLTFLRSTNWWTSFINMALSLIAGMGVFIPEISGDDIAQLVKYGADKQWLLLFLGIVTNVANILIHRFTPNPAKVLVTNTNVKGGKTSGDIDSLE